MQILIKIGLNPAELWPKPFLLGQLLFVFSCPLGQLLAGPSIRKPRQGQFEIDLGPTWDHAGWTFRLSWNRFETNLGQSWGRVWATLGPI